MLGEWVIKEVESWASRDGQKVFELFKSVYSEKEGITEKRIEFSQVIFFRVGEANQVRGKPKQNVRVTRDTKENRDT